jgi:hypothetical protein
VPIEGTVLQKVYTSKTLLQLVKSEIIMLIESTPRKPIDTRIFVVIRNLFWSQNKEVFTRPGMRMYLLVKEI